MKRFSFMLGLLCATSLTAVLGVDLTTDEGGSGAEVVLATVAKIESSGIFYSSDKRILRRIAFVETRDGADQLLGPNGGVWNVPMQAFSNIQRDPVLAGLRDEINSAFTTELAALRVERWEDLEWRDLTKPLLSGLAARLMISLAVERNASLPTSSDVRGQALFWKAWYNPSGDVDKFVSDVEQLEKGESCTIKSDVIFVLDSSGSVGPENYREAVNFTYRFVEALDIGPADNRVGVVIYSSYGYTVFNLNNYTEKGEMLEAIESIPYIAGGTNTADGLCLLLKGFSEENGARLSEDGVFRLAVVMTDGHSNQITSDCNYTSTIEAAEAVHDFSHPILVFAIGVTNSVNDEELKAIASRDDYITYLDNFNEYLFRETSDEQTYELCERATIPVEVGLRVGSLSRGGRVRYELQVPLDGVTVNLCVNIGTVLFYGSFTVPNPNPALYDYIKEVESRGGNTCGDVFIQPEVELSNINRVKRRANDRVSPINATTTANLYISLEGTGEQNIFVLETSVGDNTCPGDSDEEFPVIVIAALTITGVIVLLSSATCIIVAICLYKRDQRD